MSKNAGDSIKPHIPQLVTALLEALSGLEPQVMNYISLHVGNDKDAQEKVSIVYIVMKRNIICTTKTSLIVVSAGVSVIKPSIIGSIIPRVKRSLEIQNRGGGGSTLKCPNGKIIYFFTWFDSVLTKLGRNDSWGKGKGKGHQVIKI